MPQLTLSLTLERASAYKGKATDSGPLALQKLSTTLNGVAAHTYAATAFTLGGTQASGALTFVSGSGTVGGTINGVSLTFTATGTDAGDAAAFAALVAASTDPLVAGLVTASSAAGVATVVAVDAGKSGNAITLAKVGTGVTASGARLTGGAADSYIL